ncbi:DNA helicase [Sarracenia purpurea var. burkii]
MRTLCVVCHADVTAAQCAQRRSVRVKAKKQLKVVINSLKNIQNAEQTDFNPKLKIVIGCAAGETANTEDQGLVENTAEDELLITVPGSAYSGAGNCGPRTEKRENIVENLDKQQ